MKSSCPPLPLICLVPAVSAQICSYKSTDIPGDIILHMGPLIAYDRLTTVDKIMKGLEEGSRKYE